MLLSMLQFLLYLFLLFIWYNIGDYFYYFVNKKNFKLSKLYVSVVHASSVVLSYLIGVPGYILLYWSTTYYIIDTFYEILELVSFDKKSRLYTLGMLLHHGLTIMALKYLCYPATVNYMYYAFFLAELSNFPMYLVYQLKSLGYDHDHPYLLKFVICIEAMTFIYLRLIIGGSMGYEMFWKEEIPPFMKFSAYVVFIISLIWTNKLINQLLAK